MGPTRQFVLAAIAVSVTAVCVAGEWSGSAGVEATRYLHEALYGGQENSSLSFFLDPEFYHDWDDGNQRVVFAPFLRADQHDTERTHADLREFYWRRSFDSVELAVGLRKVYWGVTESVHLVDIVNQTDFVENLDGEDKLGQPMISVSWLNDWGTLDFYLLPYFRERSFAGTEGRPRPGFFVDQGSPVFESSRDNRHLDLAVRYSHYFGDFDIGLAHFSGTSREPRLVPSFNPARGLVLIPHYDLLEQTSLDVQATLGGWLLKTELISRDNFDGRSTAFVGGFEYTLVGLFDSAIDLGVIVEYLFDDQPAIRTGTRNDVAVGGRLAFNDVQATELLAFSVLDADSSAYFSSVEGSRRLGQSWRLSLEGRFFSNASASDFLFGLRDDDYLQLTLEKFF